RAARWIIAQNHTLQPTVVPPPAIGIRSLAAWQVTVELLCLLGLALLATPDYWRIDQPTQLAGREAQWLTSSAYLATESLHTLGYIPLWQPYHDRGEPLIESPFAFVLNPLSTAPSLLLGDAAQGIKLSVALYALLAAWGGWLLARMLNLGWVGRLLLGVLMLSKGNIPAMVGLGWFQLGVAQVYIPYAMAATVGLIRAERPYRYGVLLAVALTLQLWAGNIWYTLPTLISVVALVALWDYDGRRWSSYARLAAAGLFTVGLSAAILFPGVVNRATIGGHQPLPNGGETIPPLLVLEQFIQPNLTDFDRLFKVVNGFEPQFYFTYTAPLLLLILGFVVLPPLLPLTTRPAFAGSRRLTLIALALFGVFLLWGIGGLQPFRWLYNHVPGVGRWRFIGRALGGASFWLAVLVAVRVDGLWAALAGWTSLSIRAQTIAPLRWGIRVVILVGLALAARNAVQVWNLFPNVRQQDEASLAYCLAWLREQVPNEPLTVYQKNYIELMPFYELHVQKFPIEADYYALPTRTGLGALILDDALPRYAIPWDTDDLTFIRKEWGYVPLRNAPKKPNGEPCIWVKPNALPYAFILPHTLIAYTDYVSTGFAAPMTLLAWRPGAMTYYAVPPARVDSAAIVREVAYPGWQAWVNGEPATLAPMGGLLSVSFDEDLPPNTPVTIHFAYRPVALWVGAWVTLCSSAAGCIALLWAARRYRPP
ncbi:MAG: hypothetical protein ACOYL5_16475, partial [Phototrophicaceae bacterium]